jgi:hypothetical protein
MRLGSERHAGPTRFHRGRTVATTFAMLKAMMANVESTPAWRRDRARRVLDVIADLHAPIDEAAEILEQYTTEGDE